MDIEFLPTTRCNFKCDYCSNQGSVDFNINDSKKTLNNLFKLLKEKNHEDNVILIVGGEPSFSKNIVSILKYINVLKKLFKIQLRIDFQTNLSMKKELYVEISEFINFFHVAYHYKELIKHKKMDIFLDNLEFVLNTGKLSNLDIMLEDVQNDEEFYNFTLKYIYPYAKKCKNSEMIYSFYGYDSTRTQRHKSFFDRYSITKNEYNISRIKYSTNYFYGKLSSHNPFKNKFCEAGLNSLVVFGNGDVFRCCSEVYYYFQNKMKPFTNIKNDFKKAMLGCTFCELDSCTSDLDLVRKDHKFIKDYNDCYRKGEVF